MSDRVTPYDVKDMERFISVQKKALTETYEQNALLVSSNAELRMFLSFMPIKYREYVSKLRAESNILYRQQRISPKVIQTNDRRVEIQLVDAPMADPIVQYALRDAEYATLGDARSHMERGIALRNRTLSDPSTRVIPKFAPRINLLPRSCAPQQRIGTRLPLLMNAKRHELKPCTTTVLLHW